MAATLDVDAAYQQIPVDIVDQPHIVFRWGHQYYIDSQVPFGAASSNSLFVRCGDAMAEFYKQRGFGIVHKWVGDFLFIQFPAEGPRPNGSPTLFLLETIYKYARKLGWPWKLIKSTDFATLFVYLGFEWDIPSRRVRLPDAKRQKYLNSILAWIESPTVSLKDTESLVGALVHCTLVIPESKPVLNGLFKFMAGLAASRQSHFSRRAPSPAALGEAKWWANILSTPHSGTSIVVPPPMANTCIHTEASTLFGIGIVIDGIFASWKLTSGWDTNGRNIGWAEAIAIEMALTFLISKGVHDTSITIHCDNQGVVYTWQAGRSRNVEQNSTIARIATMAASYNIHISIEYVWTKDNLADPPLRGSHPPGLSQCVDMPPIPDHLLPFLTAA